MEENLKIIDGVGNSMQFDSSFFLPVCRVLCRARNVLDDLQRRWAPGTERCCLGCDTPETYCVCGGFTLRVIKTRVSDRFYSYGQENRLLTGSPSCCIFVTLTCSVYLLYNSGPAFSRLGCVGALCYLGEIPG